MTKLSTLRIANIRRFADDVTFEFSPAANVILAPNGTGKTSMFEAIELALTGGIARLDKNLNAAIREGTQEARALVRFGQKVKVVRISQDLKEAVREGASIEEIFGLKEGSDLPYLLRLTHLLDQRDRDWFVQADPRDAGSQLARLPITRDSAVAFGNANAARRVARDRHSSSTKELREASERLIHWQSLIAERDLSTQELERDLRPASLIAEILQSIAQDLLGRAPRTPAPSTTYLSALSSDAMSVVKERIDETSVKLGSAREARSLIDQFTSTRKQATRIGADREDISKKLTAARDERDAVVARLQSHKRSELELTEQHLALDSLLAKQNEYAISRDRLARAREALTAEESLFASAESRLELARLERRRLLDLKLDRDNLEARLQAIGVEQAAIVDAMARVSHWEQCEGQITKLKADQEVDKARLAATEPLHQQAREAEARQEVIAGDLRRHVDELVSSSNAIRTAVLTIASQLPPDVEDCPVCGVHHGTQELRDRLQQTLEAANPLLGRADQSVRDASLELERLRSEKESLNSNVLELRSRISQRDQDEDRLAMYVANIRSNAQIVGDTPLSARMQLQMRLNLIADSKAAVQNRLGAEATIAEVARLSEVEANVEGLVRAFDLARVRKLEADRRVATELALHSELESAILDHQTFDELAAKTGKISAAFVKLQQEIAEVTQAVAKSLQLVEALEEDLRKADEMLASARREVTRIVDKWSGAGLVGEPSLTTADVVTLQLESLLSNLRGHETALSNVRFDLDRLMTAERTRKAQVEIDVLRGQMSETERTAVLKKIVDEKRLESFSAERTVEALDALSNSLSVQMGDIHNRVRRGVPTWQALLKRIVRDQRFSQSTLEFYSHYNKERAEIKVPLGEKHFPVPSVASEAQLTDVQLCFLLSLALRQTWSPWKGLLLDDPTQHHDLVHAAAVFDVLRDFIVEHDFQLILATHDAMQARYLMRKLENDGIDGRLWTLIPTEGGVRAIQSH